ncbi:MAG: Rdx family protein [Myxococcales bacterium]|nr:Rdx family protein [Myxococcales bacterium]
MPRAARAAAAIKQELGMNVELVRGSGGIYTVEVGGAIVARKTLDHGFPTDDQVVQAVKAATS